MTRAPFVVFWTQSTNQGLVKRWRGFSTKTELESYREVLTLDETATCLRTAVLTWCGYRTIGPVISFKIVPKMPRNRLQRNRLKAFLASALVGLGLSACASSGAMGQGGITTPIAPTYQAVMPPFGYLKYCVASPRESECHGGTDNPRKVVMTRRLWGELISVNDDVNRWSHVPDSLEKWEVAGAGGGDCEDLTLAKRRALLALDWPAEALVIAVGKTLAGEGHAVLMIRTLEADFILDNLTHKIFSADQTEIRLSGRQSSRRPNIWLALDPAFATGPTPVSMPPILSAVNQSNGVEK